MPVQLTPGKAFRSDESVLARVVTAAGAWDEFAREHILRVPSDEPAAYAEWLAGEVKAGRSFCFHVTLNGVRIGTAIVRFETDDCARRVAILQAGYATPAAPVNAYWNAVLPQLKEYARGLGCSLLKTVTTRPALVAAYRRHAFGIASVELATPL